MLTRADVAKDYRLDAAGCVLNPGKFEGEHWSSVVLYDIAMESGQDETRQWSDDTCEDIFILDDELRKVLQAGTDDYAISLFHDSQGFVSGRLIDRDTYESTQTEYENLLECSDND